MSSPSKVIVPALAGVSPEIDRSVVDLPAPLAPISVTTSLGLDGQRHALERLDRAVAGADVGYLEQRHQPCFPR